MPTSAAASAGASLRPSPDHRHAHRPAMRAPSGADRQRAQRRQQRGLLARQHLGMHLGDAQQLRDALRAGAAVAADHHRAHAVGLQPLDGLDGAVAQAVAERHAAPAAAGASPDTSASHDTVRPSACSSAARAASGARSTPSSAIQRALPRRSSSSRRPARPGAVGVEREARAGRQARALWRALMIALAAMASASRASAAALRVGGHAHARGHALARHRALRARGGHARVGAARHVQHGLRQRMRAAALHRSGERQQPRGVAVDGHAGDQHRLAFGERAGLVERHHARRRARSPAPRRP